MNREQRAAAAEEARRRRVVHGWAFRDLPADEVTAIRAYLAGGPVPSRYAKLDGVVT